MKRLRNHAHLEVNEWDQRSLFELLPSYLPKTSRWSAHKNYFSQYISWHSGCSSILSKAKTWKPSDLLKARSLSHPPYLLSPHLHQYLNLPFCSPSSPLYSLTLENSTVRAFGMGNMFPSFLKGEEQLWAGDEEAAARHFLSLTVFRWSLHGSWKLIPWTPSKLISPWGNLCVHLGLPFEDCCPRVTGGITAWRKTGFKAGCHWLAVWPWASFLTSVSLSFLIFKRVTTPVPSLRMLLEVNKRVHSTGLNTWVGFGEG